MNIKFCKKACKVYRKKKNEILKDKSIPDDKKGSEIAKNASLAMGTYNVSFIVYLSKLDNN